jgi:cell wall-associated NlpC family hydrolase
LALDEQVIGQLDSHKGDASLALGGNIPFVPVITDQTIKVFQDLTNKDIKRREDEYQNWEKGVAGKIAEVSKIDNVLDADREILGKKKSEIVKEIQNKAYLLHPSNQIKHRGEYEDLMTKVNDYVIEVAKSKDDAVLDKEYRKGMRDKAEWANPINDTRYQKWRATPMGEREPFSLMADPSSSMGKRILEAQKASIKDSNIEQIYSPDKSIVTIKETATLDPEIYYNTMRTPEEEAYFKAEYREVLPQEEKQRLAKEENILTEDDYAKSKYMGSFNNVLKLPSKTMPSPEYLQDQAYRRAQLGADTRIKTTEIGVEGRKDIKQMEIDAKRSDLTPKADINTYSILKPINDNINSFENNIVQTFKFGEEFNRINPNIKSVQEVNSKSIDDTIKGALYVGGADKYGSAYGKIYIVEDKNGEKFYAPAKVTYTDKNGNEIDKKLYLADKANSNEIVRPDISQKFTREQLLARSVDNTQKGKAQYNEFIKSKNDLDNLDAETTQPSSGQSSFLKSAEKFKDVKYEWGAKGGNGKMDCSGLVCAILNDNGIKVSGTSEDIYKNAPTKPDVKSIEDFKEGDIIAVDTGKTKKEGNREIGIDHVGVVVEKDGTKYFVESRGGKGFDMTELSSKWNSSIKKGNKLYVGRYDKSTQTPTKKESAISTPTKPSNKPSKNTYKSPSGIKFTVE